MTALSLRPRSIREVAERTRAGQQAFDPALREFLDSFYSLPETRQEALHDQPVPLTPFRDAYLAATAEYLASRFLLDAPAWTDTYGFALETPFFAGGLETLKPLLLVQSPAAFRRRLLFVSHDALFRPRL